MKIMHAWKLAGFLFLAGTLFGCGHNPNHGIDPEQAQAAANRVHTPPDPNVKTEPGHGG